MPAGTSGIDSGAMTKSPGSGRLWGLPRSLAGRWSLGFAGFFWVCMAVFYALIVAGVAERGNDTFAEEWPLFISIGAAALCGVGAGSAGLFALLARHERSVLVALATLLGLFVAFLAAAEVLFPH